MYLAHSLDGRPDEERQPLVDHLVAVALETRLKTGAPAADPVWMRELSPRFTKLRPASVCPTGSAIPLPKVAPSIAIGRSRHAGSKRRSLGSTHRFPPAIDVSSDLGFMLFDIDHAGDRSSMVFRARLDDGVMKVPHPASPEAPTSGLASLVAADERLEKTGEVPPFGASTEKIGFLISRGEDETRAEPPVDLRDEGGGREAAAAAAQSAAPVDRPSGVATDTFRDETSHVPGVTGAQRKSRQGAEGTGVSQENLDLLFEARVDMFEHDPPPPAARGVPVSRSSPNTRAPSAAPRRRRSSRSSR